VGVGCGLAIGWTGVGAVACGVLAGAVSSAVTYALAAGKEFSWGGLALAAGLGAVTGAIGAGIGAAAAPVVGAAARAAGASSAKTVVGTIARKAIGTTAEAIGMGACHVFSPREGSGLISGMQRLGVRSQVLAANRAMARDLAGEPPQPNAVVRDLLDIRFGNPIVPWKAPITMDDDELLASVFTPRDGVFMQLDPRAPRLLEGNHRRDQLLRRAAEGTSKKITWDTAIFIFG
jgi:hypothetical protein